MWYHSRLSVELSCPLGVSEKTAGFETFRWIHHQVPISTQEVLWKQKPKYEFRKKDVEIISEWDNKKVKSLFFTFNPNPQSNQKSKLFKITLRTYRVEKKYDSKMKASNDEGSIGIEIESLENVKNNIIIQECISRNNIWRWFYLENYQSAFNKKEFLESLKEFLKTFHWY